MRIIPEALTQAAEYETGNLSVVEIPFGETRRWEHGASRTSCSAARRSATSTSRSTRPADRCGTCGCAGRSTWRTDVEHPAPHRMADRGVRAAGAIPPGILGYDSTRAPYPWDTAGARRLLAEAGYAEGLPAPALAQQARRAGAHRAVGAAGPGARLGIRVEIVERDAPSVRATVRNGEADLYLGDWYADYPDPENFSYPLFHSSNKGPGGNYAFLADTGARRDDPPRAQPRPTRWRRRGSRARSTRGSSTWRPGSSSGSRSTSGPCSPT